MINTIFSCVYLEYIEHLLFFFLGRHICPSGWNPGSLKKKLGNLCEITFNCLFKNNISTYWGSRDMSNCHRNSNHKTINPPVMLRVKLTRFKVWKSRKNTSKYSFYIKLLLLTLFSVLNVKKKIQKKYHVFATPPAGLCNRWCSRVNLTRLWKWRLKVRRVTFRLFLYL